jgi:hypothetical protein
VIDLVESLYDIAIEGFLVVIGNIDLQFAVLILCIVTFTLHFIVNKVLHEAEEDILILGPFDASHSILKHLLDLVSVGLFVIGGVLVDLLAYSLESAVLYSELVFL